MSRYYYTEWNTDSSGNKKLEHIQNEFHKIVNNKFFLDQVPDEWSRVKINNMFEVSGISNVANETQFKVNYDNGEITFHSNLEGSDITVTEYYGVGLIKISSKRIVFENDGSTIVATDIDGAIKEQNSRIDNLVSNSGVSNQEIVDGRNSSVKNTTYTTLKNRLDASETDIENINTEIENARKGEVDLVTKINTIDSEIDSHSSQLSDIAVKLKNYKCDGVLRKLEQKQAVKFVCYGDSMTWGYLTGGIQAINNYPSVLQTKLRYIYGYNDITVINNGMSGNTSAQGVSNFTTKVLNESPDLVIIMFGLNDNGVADISLESYKNNLRTMVETAQDNNIKVILMSPTATIDRVTVGLGSVYNLTNRDYAEACKTIATECKVDFIDMNKEYIDLWKNNAINNVYYDGTIHFDDYTLIADIVIKERLCDIYANTFSNGQFISFNSPYVFNDVISYADLDTNSILRTYYNIREPFPTESIKLMIYNNIPNAQFRCLTIQGTTTGNIVVQNFGVDFATIDTYNTVSTRDIEEVLNLGIGLYFLEFKASKVDVGKTFSSSGGYIYCPQYEKPLSLGHESLTLQNSWVNNGGGFTNLSCWEDRGVVKIEGQIKNGTTTDGTVISNLRVGRRPLADKLFTVSSYDGVNVAVGMIRISSSTGDIICFKNIKNVFLTLEGIEFPII